MEKVSIQVHVCGEEPSFLVVNVSGDQEVLQSCCYGWITPTMASFPICLENIQVNVSVVIQRFRGLAAMVGSLQSWQTFLFALKTHRLLPLLLT